MNAFTRRSCGSQSCVPSSEPASCTMCSTATPSWSATEAIQSLSQGELRKLGVMMDIFTQGNSPDFSRGAETLRDGDAPAHPESPGGNLQARSCLPAFVFSESDLVHHVIDHGGRKALLDDFVFTQILD